MENKELQKLKDKLEKLEDRLYNTKLKEHKVVNNMGWGAGMRRSKVTISTRVTDEIKEKIKDVKKQIENMENNQIIKENVLRYKADGNTLTDSKIEFKKLEGFNDVFISLKPDYDDYYKLIIPVSYNNKTVYVEFDVVSLNNINEYQDSKDRHIQATEYFKKNIIPNLQGEKVERMFANKLKIELAERLGINSDKLKQEVEDRFNSINKENELKEQKRKEAEEEKKRQGELPENNKILNTRLNYGGIYGILTRKEFIEKVLADGGRLEVKQVQAIKDLTRSQSNNMSWAEINRFENKQKEAGTKPEYRIYTEGNSFYTITKTEYDYGMSLQNNLKGGISDNQSIQDIANKHNVSVAEVEKAIERGIKVEMEHTDNELIAKEIAKDHVDELGVAYYVELDKMEEKLKENKPKIIQKEVTISNILGIENSEVIYHKENDKLRNLEFLIDNKPVADMRFKEGNNGYLFVSSINVLEQYRKKGIATKLYELALTYALNNGYKGLESDIVINEFVKNIIGNFEITRKDGVTYVHDFINESNTQPPQTPITSQISESELNKIIDVADKENKRIFADVDDSNVEFIEMLKKYGFREVE